MHRVESVAVILAQQSFPLRGGNSKEHTLFMAQADEAHAAAVRAIRDNLDQMRLVLAALDMRLKMLEKPVVKPQTTAPVPTMK